MDNVTRERNPKRSIRQPAALTGRSERRSVARESGRGAGGTSHEAGERRGQVRGHDVIGGGRQRGGRLFGGQVQGAGRRVPAVVERHRNGRALSGSAVSRGRRRRPRRE